MSKTNDKIEKQVEAAHKVTWPNGDSEIRKYLVPIIAEFAQLGCCDSNFLTEFKRGELGPAISRTWEAMLYSRFKDCNWSVSGCGSGPDFQIEMEGDKGKVFVEAIVAQPGDPNKSGLSQEWQDRKSGDVFKNIYDKMLPRLTSAIRTKKDNHIKHIKGGHADANTPFVIAVNEVRLGSAHGHHPCTGLPLIVHAVFPIGTPAVIESVETCDEIVPWRLQWRDEITKRNGASVRTDSFLDSAYADVSAVIGCSNIYELNDEWRKFYRGQPKYVVVHNPLAKNPLPRPWLPGAVEYVAGITVIGIKRLV